MNLEITNLLLGLLANVVRFYAIKRFINIFLSQDECSWKYTGILYIVACIWTELIYVLFMSPILNIFSNLTGFFLIVLPYKVKMSRKILIIFMIYVINVLVDSIVVILFTKYAIGKPINQIYGCITSIVILLIAIILEKTISVEKDVNLPMFYRVVLGLIPVISIACIYYMVMTITHLKVIVIIVTISVLFVNIFIFYLYNSLVQFYSAYIEKKIFEQMVEVYAYQLELVQKSQERVNSLRHDMKHHIIELTSMIKQDKNQEIINYLHEMENFMLNPEEYVSTGNKEIDGILNYLLQKAEELLDCVEVKINIPDKIYWRNFNICVILGNLVDNAIREASRSESKYLKINIYLKQEVMIIFVENSYSGKLIEVDNKFKSSQENLKIHGIGLENVKKVVEANNGEIKIDYSDHRFRVQILLYLSEFK